MKRLGTVLRRDRIMSEKSQKEYAAEVGISPSELSKIEVGKGVDAKTILTVQQWLFET